jgi:thiamine kinase-like enzyme
VELAQMMRRYHDATTDFVPPADVRWLFVYSKRRSHEVICHNDIAPYNIIYVDNHPQAFIDFDCAGPGPRAWDMAYAAYRCVPLGHAREPELVSMGLADLAQQARRLNLFCSTYGIAAREVLKFVQPRLRALCTWLTEGHANGDPIRQRMVIEGHLLHYQLEIEQWQKSVGHLQQLLLGN